MFLFWASDVPYRSDNVVNNENIDNVKNDKIDKNVEHISNDGNHHIYF